MTKIVASMPADAAGAAELHARLVEAGQALDAAQMPIFLLTARDDSDRMIGGCKGEIAFATAHVSELWVAPDARGLGLGTDLLKGAEGLAQENRCTRLHLETRSTAARTLYERLGYAVFGELPRYDGDESLWYLAKSL